MTNVTNHHASGMLFGLFGAIGGRLRARRELNYPLGFSDHELRDIGVTRADLHREVMKPVWRA